MNKDLIRSRFEKSIKTYDENAKVQNQMAEKLVSLIDKDLYEDVLEIGCGTGILTKKIINKIQYRNYTANDIVPSCEKYIMEIDKSIAFVGTDIEECLAETNNKYDLIISNASIQWVKDFEQFLKTLISRLKPNGILLFSTFGQENFREIRLISEKTLKYYSKKELENILKPNLFTIEEEIRILSFKTPKDVLKHIKYTGVNAIENTSWTKGDLIRFENAYNNFCSNRPTLTYNHIYAKVLNG
jgi:malonyl-CoA O-methyltransferase